MGDDFAPDHWDVFRYSPYRDETGYIIINELVRAARMDATSTLWVNTINIFSIIYSFVLGMYFRLNKCGRNVGSLVGALRGEDTGVTESME